jgi:hypothetical protein
VKEFIASGDSVTVIGYCEATITTTGRDVASDWVMTFTITDGKITQFREFTDSAATRILRDRRALRFGVFVRGDIHVGPLSSRAAGAASSKVVRCPLTVVTRDPTEDA